MRIRTPARVGPSAVLSPLAEGVLQVFSRLPVVRPDPERFPEMADRGLDSSLAGKEDAEMVLGLRVIGP